MVSVRKREKSKLQLHPPTGRHSRFGGTYVLQNVKSVSDNDVICHQSLERAMAMDFTREKTIKKKSHRVVQEQGETHRRSAFSVRWVFIFIFVCFLFSFNKQFSFLDYFYVNFALKFLDLPTII